MDATEVLDMAGERFERRLTEEASTLRIEMHEGFAALRTEIHQGMAGLRTEIHESLTAVRQEMAAGRVELLRWSFLFWIGQVAAMGGMFALMLKALDR